MIAVVLGEDSWSDVSERAAGLLNLGFNPPILSRVGNKVDLGSFEATPVTGSAVDMHDFGICKPGKRDDEADAGDGSQSSQSVLEPRFVLMAPVVVTTGGADPRPGAPSKPAAATTARVATAAPGKPVPLPRLRPAPVISQPAAAPSKLSLDD
jgi:hypothetical protein